MRILLIEDDEDVSALVKASLESENFIVDCVSDGIKGSYTARTNDYDVAIIDHNLPGRNGLQICKDIRVAHKTFPIIMLSIIGAIDTKVDTLSCGADDYMTKPFHMEELLARIRALLRRPRVVAHEIFKVGDLTLNSRTQEAKRGKHRIYFTRKEFSLIEYLMRNKGTVISRGMIMEHVWSIDGDPFSNTIEAHILNLRKKINIKRKKNLIHNVPGRGYKIEDKKT